MSPFYEIWNPSDNDMRVELESTVPLGGRSVQILRPITQDSAAAGFTAVIIAKVFTKIGEGRRGGRTA